MKAGGKSSLFFPFTADGDRLFLSSFSFPPSERENIVPLEEDTEVESIFTDNIGETQATPQLPNTGGVDAPLNPDQRIALAGGNLDEAIALGSRRG